ncbi:winged helix-turn-helix transcriptional regulator [Actinomadura rugatobispora]|uniref:Winged helix-turn-helix transcriptional regulator n=1 Tax=Actinomadura rugatobispora TaxID=1994 RepID=A0ABW1A2T5_9ACTN|nr:helix-turn-helix domain-containing protein [Actinomadura rugatobispora]
MAEHRPPGQAPSAAAISLLAERWTYLVIREIFFGVRRFGQIQRALGIAPNILTSRLTMLVDVGILVKHRYRTDPDWYEYRISENAQLVVPPLLAIAQWAEEHLGDDPVMRVLRHESCGKITHPVLACSECGEQVTARGLLPETVDRPGREPR